MMVVDMKQLNDYLISSQFYCTRDVSCYASHVGILLSCVHFFAQISLSYREKNLKINKAYDLGCFPDVQVALVNQ